MKVKLRLTLILVSAFILLSYSTYSQTVTKQLYLTDPSQGLDRVDPVATADATTASTTILGQGVPELDMATYIGMGDVDAAIDITVDASGYIYVTGRTNSTNYPVTGGAYDQTHNGGYDAFVTKLDPTGSSIIWSTFLGGSSDDEGNGIEVDGSGNVYVLGETNSSGFPTVNAYDSSLNGDGTTKDVFVAKLSADGGSLLYSTFFGGSDNEDVTTDNMALVGQTVYFAARTRSSDLPLQNAFDSSLGGTFDGSAVAINTSISGAGGLQFSSYIGGSGTDYVRGIDVDGSGNMYIIGFISAGATPWTTPTSGAFDTSIGSGVDGFLLKLSSTGTKLYATYISGNDYEAVQAIHVATDGYVYITGQTESSDFLTTTGAYDETHFGLGNSDVYVYKMDLAGNGSNDLIYGTFLSGSNYEITRGIEVQNGIITVAGYTSSTDFPTVDAFQSFNGVYDVFVSKINPAGNGSNDLVASTYLGGTDYDQGEALALDASGNAYVTGNTYSADFPTTTGAYDETYGGNSPNHDVFVAKVGFDGAQPDP